MLSEKAKGKFKHCSVNNIFDYEQHADMSGEIFDILCQHQDIKIERIVSAGHVTPEDEPYIQDTHEWVILLKGQAEILTKTQKHYLNEGDYLFIPAKTEHRVAFTSSDPVCIWLAVHFPADNE
ncbi:MAG: cupin domain-containing protein [Bacteroidales bacterium]